MCKDKTTKRYCAGPYDCVIVGGGLSGLCCGALLARAGRRVLVCEKQQTPGGCCTSFWRKGYRFDLSVQSYSGCGPEGAVGSVLRTLGVENEIEFRRLDPAREYLFPDRTIILPASVDLYRESLLEQFPNEREGLTNYLRLQQEIYEEIRRLPTEIALTSATRFEEDFPRLTEFRRATLADVLATHVRDPKLRAILAVRSSYFALPPSQVSFVAVSNMEMNYFAEGVYVARGGAQALTDAIVAALKRHGGELALGTEVMRVRHEAGQVVGVETADGQAIATRRVVAAMSSTSLFHSLLEPSLGSAHPYMRRLAALRTSVSYFVAFWGITTSDLGGSTIGNKEIFEDYEFEREYAALARGEMDPHAPCFVLVPSMVGREAVPDGQGHTVCASVKAVREPDGGWTKGMRAALADRLFEQARRCLPALDHSYIEVAETVTPAAIERLTGNLNGSPYGWAHVPGQVGLDRPGPTTPIKGLYLVGHWTRPGGGVASVIVSARSLATRLLEREGETGI
jgi:prolycopene isomerase